MNQNNSSETFRNTPFPTAEDMMPSSAFISTNHELGIDVDSQYLSENTSIGSSRNSNQTNTNHDSFTMLSHYDRPRYDVQSSFTGIPPPSPSERWRNYLEVARGNSASYTSDEDVQTNINDRTSNQLNRNSSSSSLDFNQTDPFHFSHARINSPVSTDQVRQPVGIPRFFGGKVCDPTNFKNGEKLLKFEVIQHDGSHISVKHKVQNILRNDESVYCSLRGGVINVLLKYAGYSETGFTSDTICTLSKIIIKSPERGYSWPCSGGLVFISHKEIDIMSTNGFDSFTKESYENYVAKKEGIMDDTDPAGFFSLDSSNFQKDIIKLSDRPAKYILVKLLSANCVGNSSSGKNVDLQYIGLVGRSGPRSFAAAMFR